MEKPKFYDEVKATDNDYRPVMPGGYICTILSAKVQKSKAGNDMLVLALDIADGEYKDYYKERFDKDTREDKKWGCVLRMVIDDPTKDEDTRKKMQSRLKGAIKSIEDSNEGFTFDWDEEKLKGKTVGGEFAIEEYIGNDGSTKTSTKINRLRSVETIKKGIPMPRVKLIDGTYMDYDIYMEQTGAKSDDKGQYITVDPEKDDLPF